MSPHFGADGPLGAADALQLAAAFIAAERRPSSLEIVTLDDRLAGAAQKGVRLIEVPSAGEQQLVSALVCRDKPAGMPARESIPSAGSVLSTRKSR